MAQSRSRLASALALVFGLAAVWNLPTVFVGTSVPMRGGQTKMNGYRLDWMLFGDGASAKEEGLTTQDGYWIGERGFMKSQAAQGLRYRMRPTSEELKTGADCEGYMWQLGPLKARWGEVIGGTGNNEKLREIKQKMFDEGITDPVKIAENEYWIKRYGHPRWFPKNPDQSTGLQKTLFRGLGAFSGYDPKNEESYPDAPWKAESKSAGPGIKAYNRPSTPEQFALELQSGKVGGAPQLPEYQEGVSLEEAQKINSEALLKR